VWNRLRGRGSHRQAPRGAPLPSSGPCRMRYCVVSAPPSSALVTAMQPGRKRRAEWYLPDAGAAESLGLSRGQTQGGRDREGLAPGTEPALGCWHRGWRSSWTERGLSGSHELLTEPSSYCSMARETPADRGTYVCTCVHPLHLPGPGTAAAPLPGHSRGRAGRPAARQQPGARTHSG